MASGRRRGRLGRHLKPLPALPLIKADEVLARHHETWTGQGYALKDTVRAYATKGGRLSLTFVWRRRRAGGCDSVTVNIKVPLQPGRAAP